MTAMLPNIYIFPILGRTKEVQIFKGLVRKRGPVIFARSPACGNVLQFMRIFTLLTHTNVKTLRLVKADVGQRVR